MVSGPTLKENMSIVKRIKEKQDTARQQAK